jgi:hypothetical protein
MKRLIAVFSILLVFCTTGLAATLYVPDTLNDPPQWTTIQGAINASSGGDTIIVANGTYEENLSMGGKAITLISANGAANCTIEGQAPSVDPLPTISVSNAEGNATVIDGFTITGGTGMLSDECG